MTAVAVCNKCCGLRPLQVTDGYLQFEGPKGPDGYHVLYIDEYEYEDAMSGGWHRCCCPHYLAREAAATKERVDDDNDDDVAADVRVPDCEGRP